LRDLIHDAQHGLRALQARLSAIESSMANLGGDALAQTLREYGDVAQRFELAGGYEIERRAGAVLAGLGLSEIDPTRPLEAMSGGEKTRTALAALLIRVPDVLLLDEPTNHLDGAVCAWLESFLRAHRGAALIVSHDRRFLDAIATSIVEIDEHSHEARNYGGDYSAYARAKAAEHVAMEAAYARQQEEMAALQRAARGSARQVGHNRAPTDSDKFAKAFFKGRVESTISRKVRNAEQALEALRAHAIPKPPRPLSFNAAFANEELRARFAIEAAGISVDLGGVPILEDVNLDVPAGGRILVTGSNGAGKTTLLRALAGELAPSRGAVRIAPRTRIGFLAQEPERPPGDETLFDLYRIGRTGELEALLNELIWTGLFTFPDTQRRARDASAGQYRKLQLASLLAAQPNTLLLDEPTNHFSLQVIEQFEAAIGAFPGPVVAVSHDRRFAEVFGGVTWRLEGGRLARL
jgi:macrolide transport system ATP-binding/permease protein